MTTFVALLRAVNLGSKGMIAMAELRGIAEKLGLAGVKTLLQTGNLIFQTDGISTANLETRLEQATQRHFDYEVPICVRTAAEWRKVVAANPFPREAGDDPSHLVAFSLKQAPAADALALLRNSNVGPEYFEARDRALYIVYPKNIGESKFTGALIERKLGVRGTGRNWNTVQKIAAAL
jgi:uncharacterized protein (DUF1697 family)